MDLLSISYKRIVWERSSKPRWFLYGFTSSYLTVIWPLSDRHSLLFAMPYVAKSGDIEVRYI